MTVVKMTNGILPQVGLHKQEFKSSNAFRVSYIDNIHHTENKAYKTMSVQTKMNGNCWNR